MKKPLLSIGMIIKNEIRCLERCLKSLEPLRKAIPCELVIADTGSTDGSRELAALYADILFDFVWVNDFSAARNAVLERCTGEWYLTIDADEWLEDIEELVAFLTGPEGKYFNTAMVYQHNYGDPLLLQYSNSLVPRMGKLREGKLRYQYSIHEVLYFVDNTPFNTKLLENTFLHHDGYVDIGDGSKEAKGRRNMELLREEQKKHPQDLRTLCQCVQSAVNNDERHKYIALALDAASQANTTNPYLPVVYQLCLHVYTLIPDYEPVEPCLKKALEVCPDSYLLRLDGEAFAAIAAHNTGRWSEAREHVGRWETALADLASHNDTNQPERLFSAYVTRSPFGQSMLRTLAVDAMIHMGDYESAAQLLPQIHLDLLVRQNALNLLNAIMSLAPHQSEVAASWLRNFWVYALEQSEEKNSQRKENGEALLRFGEALFRQQFPVGEEPGTAAEALAQMGDCTPGRCARVLLSTDPTAIDAIWAEETDWPRVFPEALLHGMELGMPFPPGLLRQRCETMAEQAVQMAQVLGLRMVRTLVRWLKDQPQPETPAQLTWQLDLVTASLRTPGWTEDVPLGESLCAYYANLSSTYLDNVYNPNLLNEEDLSILPGMHRFAWHYRRALSCLETGDELGYVRALRAGLDTAPAMKDMVDFLVDHAPKPQPAPSPELLALAGQVKAALAQYAPDDPAVLQLKATPVYQSVASLLEDGTSIPAKESPDPVLEDAIRALEKDCTFGNATQAAIALQASYQGVHPDNQKNLANYWAKYPLWGETPDQVFAAAGKAFADHHDDLFWLFGRLGDNQSRRVLLAVLSNWRFYDFWKLNAVKETRYDDYFDLDLLRCDDNEVVADLGAYTGDTFLSYVKNYGSLAYKRYYCYEITSDSFAKLAQATKPYPRVILRRKGAGDGPGTMTLSAGSDASANTLTADAADTTEQETAGETVDIVALDDDITEPLTLIKMDIEGAEQAALRGCARHIREDRPKLALSVYHNFEDIWKLPRMIEELVPGYRFYLRYHGGNLWATEISLLALPPERK